MIWKRFMAILASVFLIFVSACNLPVGPAVVSGPNQDATAAIETQIAEIVASTAAAQTALANAVASTLTAMPTNTPESTFTPSLTLTPSLSPTPSFTLTPSFTPTPTFTLTPEVPMVSVSVETNCRTGPGTAYDIVGALQVGRTAEVVGRASDSGSWIIRNPSNPGTTCWLWGQYATVTGNWQSLPVIAPPPTPTPNPEFVIVSTGTTYEPLWIIWTIDVSVQNTGGLTWQSGRVVMHDNTSGANLNGVPTNKFQVPPGTPATSEDLTPGEIGGLYAAPLPYNPAGHSLTVTVTLCTKNGLAGTCASKVTTFTP